MTTGDVLGRLSEQYLSMFQFETARFYAERAIAVQPTAISYKELLARCFIAQNRYHKAYLALKSCNFADNSPESLRARYLFAVCCLALQRLGEVESSLLGIPSTKPKPLVIDPKSFPGGASGMFVLGSMYRQQQRRTQAITCFRKCLEVLIFRTFHCI